MTKHEEMVKMLAKDGSVIKDELTAHDCHLWHMATGLAGESTELIQAIILNNRDNIIEEIGDSLFYHTALCHIFELNYNNAIDARYMPTKYTVVCGDILDTVKKKVIYRKEIEARQMIKLLKEASLLLHGVALFHNISIKEAKEHNYNKLMKKRYPGGKYTDKDAVERKDK